MTAGSDYLSFGNKNNLNSFICSEVLKNYMLLLEQCGVSRADIENVTNRKIDQFKDPDERVPLELLVNLEKESPKLAKDDAIGLKIGKLCQKNDNQSGIVSYLASQCSTIGEGLKQAIRYSNLLSDNIHMELNVNSDKAEFIYIRKGHKNQTIQSVELALTNIITLIKRRNRENFYIYEANFQYDIPSYVDEYYDIFGENILYNQKNNKIVFPSSFLQMKNTEADIYIKNILINHAEKLQENFCEPTNFSDTVKKHILANLSSGNISIHNIASELNISRQTLYRKLKSEEKTFQDLLDNVRMTLAEEYVSLKSYTMSEVAFILGFSEVSSFYRAFKRWFGYGPKDLFTHK